MKKEYLIIAGVARAGKSTLSSKIAMEMGYQHMQMDAIIDALEKTLPGAGINTHTDSMESISEKMARFINGIMASEEYAKFDYGVVFDICEPIYRQCQQYDLPVYDTLYDREEVFAKILGETSII